MVIEEGLPVGYNLSEPERGTNLRRGRPRFGDQDHARIGYHVVSVPESYSGRRVEDGDSLHIRGLSPLWPSTMHHRSGHLTRSRRGVHKVTWSKRRKRHHINKLRVIKVV